MSTWYRARSLVDLGAALQEVRRDKGVTQEEAARLARSSRPTVSRMERGVPVQSDVLLAAAAVAGYEFVLIPRGSRVTVVEP